jgi:hypothetical protein
MEIKQVHAMSRESNNTTAVTLGMLSWIFAVIFIVAGVLNMLLVHPVPGVIYLLLSFMYLPPVHAVLKRRFGVAIPLVVLIVIGVVVLWGTLAVSDLAELLGL